MRLLPLVSVLAVVLGAPAAAEEGPILVLERSPRGPSCRAARADEAAAIASRSGREPVHVLASSDERLAPSAGLTIFLRGTNQLDANPVAKAAFVRAKARWESVITTPVTVVLDVDFGTTAFGGPWPIPSAVGITQPQVAHSPWSTFRAALVATADTPARQALFSSLPSGPIPSDGGPISSIYASTAVLRAVGLLPAVQNPASERFTLGDPAKIAFRSTFPWDFDPADGISPSGLDFDAVAVHEIGHALGFVSLVESTLPDVAAPLDVYRFPASTSPPDLGTSPRLMSTGGEHVFFAGGAPLPLADGARFQAGHWQGLQDVGTPVGVMDPEAWPLRVVLTGRDLAALEAMGWKTVGTPPPEPSVRTIPIVLDAVGYGDARYTSELILSSRSRAECAVELAYTAAAPFGGEGSGTASVSLPPYGQLFIPDALRWLRDHAVPVPGTGSQGGTLRVTFRGDDPPDFFFAGARTTSPAAGGRAGLAYPAIRDLDGLRGRAFVFGLREDARDRSHLALVNLGAAPATLGVLLRSGTGDGRSVALPDVQLGPGQWTQLPRVLAGAGLANGWAVVDLVSGEGPFTAYAVFNDNVTNDGSYVPAVADPLVAEPQLVPVVVETGRFESELVLTNPSGTPTSVELRYVESASPSSGAGGSATLPLGPYEQVLLPSAVDWLRTHGASIGPKGAATYAGTVTASFTAGGVPAAGLAGARTAAPEGGGAFGLFTPAVGLSRAFVWSTWVFGLRQDATVRSNLAVIHVGDAGKPLTLRVDVFDGATGALAGSTDPFTLGPGGWKQLDGILAGFGLANGYARVVYESGLGSFFAYGVINDGATPSSGGTNDGSYVAASKY